MNSSATKNKPWLENPDWKGGVIRSGAKASMYRWWGVTIIWNLLWGTPLFLNFFSNPATISSLHGYKLLLLLLFPLIGLGLLFWAIKVTREWRRFGATPLIMNPFPGSIGGEVGGKIQVNMTYDPQIDYKLTLSCIRSYMSGSRRSDSRARHEEVKWQDENYAKVHPSANGLDLEFRFQVPDGLPSSEEYSDNYHLWRLYLEANIPGANLDRSFEIPVYVTS